MADICPHGYATQRHCMWCLAAQLERERQALQALCQRPACACCGRPCRPEDAPVCLACTLLGEEETDTSEAWNDPEQHWDTP
jgi:hypothetical protein